MKEKINITDYANHITGALPKGVLLKNRSMHSRDCYEVTVVNG